MHFIKEDFKRKNISFISVVSNAVTKAAFCTVCSGKEAARPLIQDSFFSPFS